jgi:hypothetical protein
MNTCKKYLQAPIVATPLWGKCEVAIHTPEMGTWESFGTPENLELNFRGQDTWSVDTVGKVLKRRCRKWPHMGHYDICSTSYVQKKDQESNWQFDSQPLKVGNRPDPSACRWSATHCWKALKESYKFSLDLILIGGLNKELWATKVPGVQTRTISNSFEIPTWESWDKRPFGCGPRGVVQSILYGGRWWFPSSSGRGESSESRVALGLF